MKGTRLFIRHAFPRKAVQFESDPEITITDRFRNVCPIENCSDLASTNCHIVCSSKHYETYMCKLHAVSGISSKTSQIFVLKKNQNLKEKDVSLSARILDKIYYFFQL